MVAVPDSNEAAQRALGMTLMVIAMFLVPWLDAISKLLLERLAPAQVASGRFLAQTAVLLPLLLASPHRRWPVPGHFAAGLFLGIALLCFTHALRVMPIANAISIFFVAPLILTVLGAVVLKERIGWRRIGAVLVGLLGALVVLRPNVAAYGPDALWPLGTAVLFSCYMLTTRMMSRGGSGLVLQFWTGAVAAAVLTLAMLLPGTGAQIPLVPPLELTAREWALFAALGALAALAHQLIVRAMARIEAGEAAPFQYLEIVSATLLGWFIFGDFPDAMTWVGTAIIVGAGLYVFRRAERLRA